MECLPHLRNAWPEMAASQSVIPTFPVSQLVCPAWFSFSVITPKWDMACVTTREIRWTAGICDFQCFQQYCCNCCGNRMASGYNRTDRQSWKQPFCFCRFDNLVGRCSGTDQCVLGRKLAASYSQAICNGPIPSNPQAV